MRGKIVELSTAFSTYARDPKVLARTFGLSVLAHLCIFLSFYFAARAFGVFPGINGMIEILSVLPIILTIASLPISLSGVGVREQLFQNVLSGLFGTPESRGGHDIDHRFSHHRILGSCWRMRLSGLSAQRRTASSRSAGAGSCNRRIDREQGVSRRAGRPRVIANFALTADGKVSTRNFTPTGFTSKADKRRLLEIRCLGDALLAGARTISTDRMSMGISASDLRERRRALGLPPEPLRVIVSNRGDIDPCWKVFQRPGSQVIAFSTQKMPQNSRASIARLADLWIFDSPKVDLAAMLRILRSDYRVRTLVCEGGPSLFRALLEIGGRRRTPSHVDAADIRRSRSAHAHRNSRRNSCLKRFAAGSRRWKSRAASAFLTYTRFAAAHDHARLPLRSSSSLPGSRCRVTCCRTGRRG